MSAPAPLLALLRAMARPLALVAVGTVALLPVLYMGRTDLPAAEVDTSLAGTNWPLRRLATTTLFQAGFIRNLPVEPLSEDEDTPQAPMWLRLDIPQICTEDPVVIALVAAEASARPAWRRDLELSLAEAAATLTGRFPDWSYGMAQIRLGTARAAIQRAQHSLAPLLGPIGPDDLSDRALLDMLSDRCAGIQVATLVVSSFREPGDSAAKLAERYRGGTARPAIPGVITYERLVAEMARFDGFNEVQVTEEEMVQPIYTLTLPTLPEAADPTPLACLEVGPHGMGALYYLPPGDRPDDAPITAASFRDALSSIDPAAHDLYLRFDPGLLAGEPLEVLTDLREGFDSLPGIEMLPWRSITRLPAPTPGADDPAQCATMLVSVSPAPVMFHTLLADPAGLVAQQE